MAAIDININWLNAESKTPEIIHFLPIFSLVILTLNFIWRYGIRRLASKCHFIWKADSAVSICPE
jgi:hypothetical protein